MKPVLLYGLLASLFLCFGSCKNTDDEFLPDDVLPPVKEGYVRMQITVPGLAPVSTYSLSEADECHVSEVDVLVFDAAGKYLCRAYAQGQDIVTDSSNSNKKTFDVYLDGAGNATGACVMVVANAHDAIEAVNTASPFDATTTREAVMQSVQFDSPGKWNVPEPPATNLTPFPMWGGLSSVDLSNTASVPVPSIPLIRSIARIDVGVNFPDDVIDGTETGRGLGTTFTLESIELHNSLDGGLVAPNGGIYPASAPSIPTTPAPGINDSPVPFYSAAPATAIADGFSPDRYSCTGAIYMAEQFAEPAVDGGGPAKRPCLVVGGRYGSSTADITYYRLDFVSGSYPSQTFLDVLRNHRYRFNITKVDGPGYDTPEEAFDAAPVNLTVSLTATDESLTSYVYDGQYVLGVSQDEYVLDRASTADAFKPSNELKISTTFANYRIVSVLPNPGTADAAWLTILPSPGVGTYSGPANTHTLSVTANSGNSERSATITVTSGRLEKKITVRQRGVAFSVDATPDSYGASGGGKTLAVASSYPWSVNVKSDPDAIIQTFTASGTGAGTFGFTLKNNSSGYLTLTATLTFFSPTGEFEPVDRVIRLAGGSSEYRPANHKGWAGSNIYWDGSKLTFDDTPAPGVTPPHEKWQGVFFKWGSLVGLDPSWHAANSTSWNPAYNKVYRPNWNSGNPAASTWGNPPNPVLTASVAGYANWVAIPYGDHVGSINAVDRAVLYENAYHKPENRRGDICRYLTETGAAPGSLTGTKWRMPVANDFAGNSSDYPVVDNGWGDRSGSFNAVQGAYASVAEASAAGAYIPTANYRKTNNPRPDASGYRPIFPASGDRDYDTGLLNNVGNESHWWSSSPYNGSNAYWPGANGGSAVTVGNIPRSWGLAIRCVKE